MKKIVYTSDNGGDHTREDIMHDITEWMNQAEEFAGLTDEQKEQIKELTYNMLLDVLTWQAPITALLEFDEEDIEALLAEI